MKRTISLTDAFSLIELMVVIAIVALLTAVAIPSYQGYIQSAKATEVFNVASIAMKQWQQQYDLQNTGFFIINPIDSTYVNRTAIADTNVFPTSNGVECPRNGQDPDGLGVVCVELNNPSNIDSALDGFTFWFAPTEAGTVTGDTSNITINWACYYSETGVASNDEVIESFLSPGNCTGL